MAIPLPSTIKESLKRKAQEMYSLIFTTKPPNTPSSPNTLLISLSQALLTKHKRKYKKYQFTFKQQIITSLQHSVKTGLPRSKCIAQLSKAYSIPPKNIRRWAERIDDNRDKRLRYPSFEHKLIQQIKNRSLVKKSHIIQLAKSLLTTHHNSLTLSNGWYQKFRARHPQLYSPTIIDMCFI